VQPGGRSLRRQGSASSLPEFAQSPGPDLDRRRQARVMSLEPTSRPRPEHLPPERPDAARRGTPDGHFPTKAPLDVARSTRPRVPFFRLIGWAPAGFTARRQQFRSTHMTIRKTAVATLAAITTAALASTAVSAATLAEIQESGSIRIAVANEIPYGYVDPNGEAMGAGPDVAKAIMEELGVENIEWVTTNFSSLIPGLQARSFDMVAAEMAILPDRCQQVLFSEPNTSYGEGLLVAAGNPKDIHAYSD